MSKKPTVFLDRDGTLIEDKIFLNDPEQIVYLEGVVEGLRRLRDLGYQLIVVTNQSGIARRLVDIENLDETHRRMRRHFAQNGVDLSRFYYAPYPTNRTHWMRKPSPGMLMTAARDHQADLGHSWMIGDRWSDAEAGLSAGCRPILLQGIEPFPLATEKRIPVFQNLREAVNWIEKCGV